MYYGKYKEFLQTAINIGGVLAERKIHQVYGGGDRGYQNLSWKLLTLEEAKCLVSSQKPLKPLDACRFTNWRKASRRKYATKNIQDA
ncbi:hypothetical protein WN944_023949 [Citrus x changshan-huyou]|uniref:Uncharacterized protein n=1 Tax=Citrus x changshan-huyou TaxID=2935761 RepID=A0AAP0QBJ1_9ROSI